MKKTLTILLLILLVGTLFVSCSSESSMKEKNDCYINIQGITKGSGSVAFAVFKDTDSDWYFVDAEFTEGKTEINCLEPQKLEYNKEKDCYECILGSSPTIIDLNETVVKIYTPEGKLYETINLFPATKISSNAAATEGEESLKMQV